MVQKFQRKRSSRVTLHKQDGAGQAPGRGQIKPHNLVILVN